MIYFPYDEECYPNIWTLDIKQHGTDDRWLFEISTRKNDIYRLIDMMAYLKSIDCAMVGFNSIGYDYPVLHRILEADPMMVDATWIYQQSCEIIATPWERRWSTRIPLWKHHVPQIDLFLVHHFDNASKSVTLKSLEFAMRASNIEDLPYEPGTVLDWQQMDNLITYNDWDVDQTDAFLDHSLKAIDQRINLESVIGKNLLNHNDPKIGEDYFIKALEEAAPGCCFDGKDPRQTPRDQIALNDVVLPYVAFESPMFNQVLRWLRQQVITETKGVFSDISTAGMDLLHLDPKLLRVTRGDTGKRARVETLMKQGVDWTRWADTATADHLHAAMQDGFRFDFGTGGIHGSVEWERFDSDDEWVIADYDVR